MTRYLFDNSHAAQAERRFDALAQIFDPATFRALDRCGISAGWRCLEVGAGGGSVARWMAARVGHDGRVVATDIDPRFTETTSATYGVTLEVIRHNIATEPVPRGQFDLIHQRLVLSHVPERDSVLERLVAALAPGGWLVTEDFDVKLMERALGSSDERSARIVWRVQAALLELFTRRGVPPGWARQSYGRLRRLGLVEVGTEGATHFAQGGSPWCDIDRANLELIRGDAIAAGLLDPEDVEEAMAAYADPAFTTASIHVRAGEVKGGPPAEHSLVDPYFGVQVARLSAKASQSLSAGGELGAPRYRPVVIITNLGEHTRLLQRTVGAARGQLCSGILEAHVQVCRMSRAMAYDCGPAIARDIEQGIHPRSIFAGLDGVVAEQSLHPAIQEHIFHRRLGQDDLEQRPGPYAVQVFRSCRAVPGGTRLVVEPEVDVSPRLMARVGANLATLFRAQVTDVDER
jgi:SAM-dependent methyltransferase